MNNIFMYSPVFFLIISIILKNTFLRISFLLLCVSSSLFHMYDHEIEDNLDLMEIIYKFDTSIIFLIAFYILYPNNIICLIIYILFILIYINIDLKVLILLTYSISFLKIIFTILKSLKCFNSKLIFLTLLFVNIIMLLNNHKKYKKKPYHISWEKQNAFVWHLINGVVLYIGIVCLNL